MAYELFILPPEGAPPPLTTQAVVAAFEGAGMPCCEEPYQFGHWLVLAGFESSLNLTVVGGIVTYAGFRFAAEDDEAVVQKVADVFKGLGWLVSDDEGLL